MRTKVLEMLVARLGLLRDGGREILSSHSEKGGSVLKRNRSN